ncbi:hypothetical protein [Gracilibacillus oryzae]|uniref:hypothetical protein n=1 Tax=Gracilibacillus oryzae TaxID=1672701 RepID=UPI001296E852|nr:hypothetical protein [Gracilibacillus oryzae]
MTKKKIIKTNTLIVKVDQLIDLMKQIDHEAHTSLCYNKKTESVKILKKIG